MNEWTFILGSVVHNTDKQTHKHTDSNFHFHEATMMIKGSLVLRIALRTKSLVDVGK